MLSQSGLWILRSHFFSLKVYIVHLVRIRSLIINTSAMVELFQ